MRYSNSSKVMERDRQRPSLRAKANEVLHFPILDLEFHPMGSTELQTLLRERIREQRERIGLTKDGLADRARAAGLPWSHHTVWAIESGRRNVTLGEVLLLQVFLNTTLDRLLRTDLEVVDIDGVPIKGNALAALVRPTRKPLSLFANAPTQKIVGKKLQRDLDRIASRYALDFGALMKVRAWAAASAEKKAAHTLRLSPIEVSAAAHSLWGKGLTQERDSRLEKLSRHDRLDKHLDSNARSGHVTRGLIAELRTHLRGRRKK
jgi:transcriptional regulator with XRE-family HTH domain